MADSRRASITASVTASTTDPRSLLATPDLLSHDFFGERLVTLPVGFEVGPLAELPEEPLGHYFERLVASGIERLNPTRFHSGLVIEAAREGRRGRVTLGELDFIFQLPGEDFARHWEVSVKYYLAVGDKFMGLMVRDRLDLKIQKLMNQQLALPSQPPARAQLNELGYPERVFSQAWVKGMLFYRDGTETVPPEVSPAHGRGRWSVGLPLDFSRGDSHWVELPKARWLLPYRAPVSQAASSPSPIWDEAQARHAGELQPFAMLARVEAHEGEWVERERICVVPPEWPVRALAAAGS